jgi:hypothetical protein
MNKSNRRRRTACRTVARTLAMATAMAALVATLGAGHALAGPDERVLERQGRIARQADEQVKADKASQAPSTRFPRRFFQPEPPMSSDSWLDGDQPLGPDPTPNPPPDRDGLAVALAVAGLLLALGAATTWRIRRRHPRPEPTT